MAQNEKFEVAQILPIDSADMVIDSRASSTDDPFPAKISAIMNASNSNVRRLFHNSMMWAQSTYGHNKESNQILISFPSVGATIYRAYATPYYVYLSPDGTNELVPFDTPVAGSYAYMLETALNNLTNANDTYVGAVAAITVRYSAVTGFRIESDKNFVLHDSSTWLQNAHYTHGFGQKNGVAGNKVQWTFGSFPANGVKVYNASTLPLLNMIRYITVSCPEMSKDRKTSSVSNAVSQALTSYEMNVFPIERSRNGAPVTLRNDLDPTIINVDPTNPLTRLTVEVRADNGDLLAGQNPWQFLLNVAGMAGGSWRPGDAYTAGVINNLFVPMKNGSFNYFLLPNVYCASDEMVHTLTTQAVTQ